MNAQHTHNKRVKHLHKLLTVKSALVRKAVKTLKDHGICDQFQMENFLVKLAQQRIDELEQTFTSSQEFDQAMAEYQRSLVSPSAGGNLHAGRTSAEALNDHVRCR